MKLLSKSSMKIEKIKVWEKINFCSQSCVSRVEETIVGRYRVIRRVIRSRSSLKSIETSYRKLRTDVGGKSFGEVAELAWIFQRLATYWPRPYFSPWLYSFPLPFYLTTPLSSARNFYDSARKNAFFYWRACAFF